MRDVSHIGVMMIVARPAAVRCWPGTGNAHNAHMTCYICSHLKVG